MRKNIHRNAIALALYAAALGAAQAVPVTYFGENQAAAGNVSGSPTTARAAFLSNLSSNISSEGFETKPVLAVAPIDLLFTGSGGSLAATLTGEGEIADDKSTGRFNTTTGGSKWWDVGGAFIINFTTPIAAFGFFGTDIGDFDGQIELSLTDTNNAVTKLTVNNTRKGLEVGALLFFGFIDTQTQYKSISFGNTATGVDGFGFDDMVIGDVRQVTPSPIPEPATLALVGLSLAGLVVSRRRKLTAQA